MKIDVGLVTGLVDSGPRAAEIEAMGFDGTFSFEGPHGPFAPLVLAAEHTTGLQLSTAIAVAFARNPMTAAQDAQDLQRISRGRFTLGLGSQIRPHIERRYSMPWSRPAARMEEFVRAIRAIWASWSDGVTLDFHGDFYRHDLMTPFFVPGPNPHGDPPIALAAVGARMVEVAGRVAEGLIVHPFHTPAFLAAETLPALRRGLAVHGRDESAVEVTVQTMVAIGDDEDQVAQARGAAKGQLGFYGSTPAYRGMLDHHGFGDVQPLLRDLTREGRWADMGSHVPDELVDLVCVSGAPADVGQALRSRNEAADRTALIVYDRTGRPDALADVVAGFRSAG